MGGIWLLVGQVLVFVFFMDKDELASWLLLLTALSFGLLGLWDDVAKLRLRAKDQPQFNRAPLVGKDLSARTKFCAQALFALALTAPLLTTTCTRQMTSYHQTLNSEEMLKKLADSPPKPLAQIKQPSLTALQPFHTALGPSFAAKK